MAKLNCLIHFISLMLAGIMLLCACNAATVAPNEYASQLHNGSRAPYTEFTQTDTQYIIKGNISSAGGDYVAVSYYPYTRDNGENYYTFTLYRIWGDTSCYFALFEVTLHEISEPNPFGLKYAISSVIRLDNADFEFEA